MTRQRPLYTASVKPFTLALLLAAAAARLFAQTPAQAPQAPSPVDAAPAPVEPTRPSFADWLAEVRTDALTRGIRPEIVDEALADIPEPLPVVLERDRTQAETVFSLERYISRILTPQLVATGQDRFAANRALLTEIGDGYGVDPHVIAGIWGMESHFGQFTGVRPTIAALATLAWDPRRATLFRGELFSALEILNRGDIDLAHMKGSWAGAMGQLQFMPSSYLDYAADYDGDGQRDIWSTPADVFASIANYLVGHGWTAGESWGREVKVSRAAARAIVNGVARRDAGCRATRDMTVSLPVQRWRTLGVRAMNGGTLPASMPNAALVSGGSRDFLVYANYDALLAYNCAHSYALSVGLLSDRLAGPPVPIKAHRPAKKAQKTRRAHA
jgi:membrane-bound lytic murein transglycosylase B